MEPDGLLHLKNIFDVARFARYTIYYENNKMIKKKTNKYRLILWRLSEELCMPLIEEQSQNIQIMRNFITLIAIESIYGKLINSTSRATASSESGGSTQ